MSAEDQVDTSHEESGNRWFFIGFFVVFTLINIILIASNMIEVNWMGFGIILGAGLTLALYSFLYRDNPLYKIAEHLYLGIAAGYYMLIDWYNVFWYSVVSPLFYPDIGSLSDLILIVPVTMGFLMLTRFIPNYGWLSRYPFAFLFGWVAGYTIVSYTTANILVQAYATIQPILSFQGVHLPLDGSAPEIWAFFRSFDQFFIFLALMSTFVYFIFSIEHKRSILVMAQTGIGFIMVAFGASFGYAIMARMSLLIGRVRYLLYDWLHVNEWSVMATSSVNEVTQALFHVKVFLC